MDGVPKAHILFHRTRCGVGCRIAECEAREFAETGRALCIFDSEGGSVHDLKGVCDDVIVVQQHHELWLASDGS